MSGLAMAEGTWDDAYATVGTVIAVLEGADVVNPAMVRHQLEALEWDSDPSDVPGSMYMTFGMPAWWSSGSPSLARDAIAPFAFGLVPCPGSAMLATETSVEFGERMQWGDRLTSTWTLVKLTRKRLSLGDGAFLDFEIDYRNQRAELVVRERTSVFRYEPEPV